jgi:hypothetical protein
MRTDNEKRVARAEAVVASRIEDIFRFRLLLSGLERDGLEDAAGETRSLLAMLEEQLRLGRLELQRIKRETGG